VQLQLPSILPGTDWAALAALQVLIGYAAFVPVDVKESLWAG
jgi:hypothetical protein